MNRPINTIRFLYTKDMYTLLVMFKGNKKGASVNGSKSWRKSNGLANALIKQVMFNPPSKL